MLAYVLAYVLGYVILPTEAHNLGELVWHAAIAFKGQPPGVKRKPPKLCGHHRAASVAAGRPWARDLRFRVRLRV